MGRTTYYERNKRPENLSKEQILDLTFDLINAIYLARTPDEAADLIKDLLTADEIKDLAKRLRIAKLLLAEEKTQREIATSLHCSLATVTKVSIWLQGGSSTLKNIIKGLPKRYKMPERLAKMPIEFQAPQALLATAKYILATNQNKKLQEFSEKVESKKAFDKTFQEAVGVEFKANRRVK